VSAPRELARFGYSVSGSEKNSISNLVLARHVTSRHDTFDVSSASSETSVSSRAARQARYSLIALA